METNWNEAIEQTVKIIGESSMAYKLLHIQTDLRYNKNHNRWMYSANMFVKLYLLP